MDEKNNLSQEIDKIVVNSTSFPNQIFILSVLEPILKYYSTEGYITTIKNSKGDEISLEELVEQYFGNADDYFIIKQQEKQAQQQQEEQEQEQDDQKPKVFGWNSVPNPTDIKPNPDTSTTTIPQQQQDKEQEETE